MNKGLITKRFTRGLATYEAEAGVQEQAARMVASRLCNHFPEVCHRLLEIGCGTGMLTREIVRKMSVRNWFLNDIVPECESLVRKHLACLSESQQAQVHFLNGDAETIPFPSELDAITSSSALQWMHDLPGLLAKAHTALRQGGWFCASSFGPENLTEVRQLTGIGLPYPDISALREWLQKDYDEVHIWEQKRVLYFDSPGDVLVHLRKTGVNGIRAQLWTPAALRQFSKEYSKIFAQDGQVPLTYHLVFLEAHKPSTRGGSNPE
jgi:malonyl-ACP O-methyltransferase BioC